MSSSKKSTKKIGGYQNIVRNTYISCLMKRSGFEGK